MPLSDIFTGAEALAEVLRRSGVTTVFGYPGTSELAVCDAIGTVGLALINSRGDKEAVFMAVGANLVSPGSAVGLLHGARGLTNALGAVADARRTEVGVLIVVGTVSRPSAPYLPPHAEPDLLSAAGQFARASFDCSAMQGLDAAEYMKMVNSAVQAAVDLPAGPVLLGIPQDVLSARFVPRDLPRARERSTGNRSVTGIASALALLRSARNPVIIVDDYLLRADGAEEALAELSGALPAAVLQVAYRRGPMLFQRVRRERMPQYTAVLDPGDPQHRRLLDDADLLITVEDRNMYPRVVGTLPSCPKVALTSNPPALVKNGYLGGNDVVLTGEVEPLLRALIAGLGNNGVRSASAPVSDSVSAPTAPRAGRRSMGSDSGRMLVQALGAGLRPARRLSIVDDSQMFGGLVSLHYDLLPPAARVFGSHGGFVGSGLATAVGAARIDPSVPVACLVGDQGFANGVQALAVADLLEAPLLIVVCNNGSSVSLRKQARSDGLTLHENYEFMGNSANMSYTAIAAGYGLPIEQVSWLDGPTKEASDRLTRVVANAVATPRAQLIELLTPGDEDFWQDVWIVRGFEAPATGRP